MTAKTIVITGANSGIGFQAALHFAARGDRVVLACRNTEKAKKAQAEILDRAPAAETVILPLDVSDLSSVREFVRLFHEQAGQLDILVNNAGIVAVPLGRTADGHEMQLATNYLGAFALTGLLLPFFPASGGRIVNVGSLAHRLGKLNPDDLNWEHTDYNEWKAYANSKVAMMSFTLELNRRLQASGSRVFALGAHPGFANTNIYQNSPTLQKRNAGDKNRLQRKMQSMVPSAESAAKPIIMAAESEDVGGGEYYGPGGILETGIGGKVGRAKIKKVARDPALAKRLWHVSEAMTGVGYLSEPATD